MMKLKATIPGIHPALLKSGTCPYCEKAMTADNPSCILRHTKAR